MKKIQLKEVVQKVCETLALDVSTQVDMHRTQGDLLAFAVAN